MESENKNVAQNMGLDDRLLKTRSLMISGEINKDSAEKFAKEILVLDGESHDDIVVYINSPGGDVDAGFAIYDMIRFVSSNVKIVGMGLVASAAALIYLSVPAERRFALRNSTYLIHQPLSELKGVAIDVEIYADKIEMLRYKLDQLIADATGNSIEKVSKDTERDYWLSAKEAKEYGIVGSIIENRSEIQ